MHLSTHLNFSLVNPTLECAAEPTPWFAFLYGSLCQVNEALFVRSIGFRRNGLDWAATPVGSQKERSGGVTSEELRA